jgi:hypothetical protein
VPHTEGMKIGTWARNALASKACKEVYMVVVCVIVLDVEIENTTGRELKIRRQYKNSKQKQGREEIDDVWGEEAKCGGKVSHCNDRANVIAVGRAT